MEEMTKEVNDGVVPLAEHYSLETGSCCRLSRDAQKLVKKPHHKANREAFYGLLWVGVDLGVYLNCQIKWHNPERSHLFSLTFCFNVTLSQSPTAPTTGLRSRAPLTIPLSPLMT